MTLCHDVLIVEDEPGIRDVLRELLESEGYGVRVSENGQDGLDNLNTNGDLPCLILLDLMMPVMDGWKFIETIEKNNRLKKIPIVVISAFSQKGANLKQKVQCILEKPLDIDVLFKVVESYCA